MMPIFEQGTGQGIGHTIESFLARFSDICEDHLDNNRAKAFAFILYNFHDEPTRTVLSSKGGFARLDRLAGRDLSVFYFDSGNDLQLKSFNNIFLDLFEIPSNRKLPLVLFFKLVEKDAKDVQVVELEQENLMFAFEELYKVIEVYVKNLNNPESKLNNPSKFISFFNSTKKIAAEKFLEYVISKIGEFIEKGFF